MAPRGPEIDGFELQEFIGRGGFSTVYRAYQPKLNRVVAVKVIDADLHTDEDAQRRFERECQTIGSLTGHHAVVTVHEVGACADGQPYIAMELLERGSAHDQLKAQGPLPWPVVASIGVQVADALEAAHELGILHRDVKPANVMQDRFGRYKLGDFGIAGLAAAGQTTAGTAPATIAYAAPEVLLGQRATGQSDLYGLGATLYALLAGAPAFAMETDESVVPMVMRVTRDPLPPVDPALAAPDLRRLIGELMAKDPGDRPAGAAEVAKRLKGIEAAHLVEETRERTVPRAAAVPASSAVTDPDGIASAHTVIAPRDGRRTSDDLITGVPSVAGYVLQSVPPRGSVEDPVLPPRREDGGAPPPRWRRAVAVALDLVLLTAVVFGLLLIVESYDQPTSAAAVTLTSDGRFDGPPGTAIRAGDATTTLTVRNQSDASQRFGLVGSTNQVVPNGGAMVAAGESRTFAVPELPEDVYRVAVVSGDGSNGAFDLGGDVQFVAQAPLPSQYGRDALTALGFAAVLLVVGWPFLLALAVAFAVPQDLLLGAVLLVVIDLVIEVGLRAWRGGSPGELAAGLRAVAVDRRRGLAGPILIRWLAKPVSAIPLLAGYWAPWLGSDKRPWHDRIAGVEFTERRTAGDIGASS